MQSNRFIILVGPGEESFKVPKDLLIQSSPVFENLCISPFKESIEQTIKLPEDDSQIFQHFLIWLHSPTGYMPLRISEDSLILLGIFAEKYSIRRLLNQVSDVMRKAISEDDWRPSPEIVRAVYDGVPWKSIMRRLCSVGLISSLRYDSQRADNASWEDIFKEFADLGWDYFRRMQMKKNSGLNITMKGACRYHDHSDVIDWTYTEVEHCPYSLGPTAVAYPQGF